MIVKETIKYADIKPNAEGVAVYDETVVEKEIYKPNPTYYSAEVEKE